MTIASCRLRARTVIAGLLVLGCATAALATDKAPSSPAPTKETREKMAVLHEHLAACLRSEKTIAECHAQMMHDCRTDLGKQECHMMGMGHGMGMKHKMQPSEPPGSTSQK